LLLSQCLFLLLFISLSTQSGKFWIHPRMTEFHIVSTDREFGSSRLLRNDTILNSDLGSEESTDSSFLLKMEAVGSSEMLINNSMEQGHS